MRHSFRFVALWALIAAGCVRPPPPAGDGAYLRARRLMVPVEGVTPSRVPDTFGAKRGHRVHRASDIHAPRGTNVVAADGGTIHKLRENAAGGLTIYLIEPGQRFIYYYAHLDRFRRGLREGDQVKRGEILGTVGTTGNAPKDVPHLHFQVMRLENHRRWWDGTPVDARPLFVETGKARRARG